MRLTQFSLLKIMFSSSMKSWLTKSNFDFRMFLMNLLSAQ